MRNWRDVCLPASTLSSLPCVSSRLKLKMLSHEFKARITAATPTASQRAMPYAHTPHDASGPPITTSMMIMTKALAEMTRDECPLCVFLTGLTTSQSRLCLFQRQSTVDRDRQLLMIRVV